MAMRSLKVNVTDEEKRDAADKVFVSLFSLDEWKRARRVMFYHSLPDELSTLWCLDAIKDKELFLPRMIGDDLEVVAYENGNLHAGNFNVSEPDGESVAPETLDLIVVPGVAFDVELNRLGRGKGYYDRLLARTTAIKVGICYDFQLLDSVPSEEYDIKMDIVITPDRLVGKI